MKRDSKFELLRIVSMMMIIMSHYEIYGVKYGRISSENLGFIKPMGEIGVGLFVMISAYFLTIQNDNSVRKTVSRFKKIYTRVLFYSWIIFILDLLFDFTKLNFKNALKSIFPVIFNNYWFVTSFIFLMLLVPILNKLLELTNKNQLFIIIIILLIFSGIIPNVGQPFSPLGENLNAGVMICEYLIVGYYRLYNINIRNFTLIIFFIVIIFGEYLTNIYTGFPSIIAAAIIFFFITKLPTFHCKFINWIASSVFASYLVTENILIRIPFWKLTGEISLPLNNVVKVLFITFIVVVVFSVLDKVYVLLNKFVFSEIINRIESKVVIHLTNYLYTEYLQSKCNRF